MKKINLRDFYPQIYKSDHFIDLPDDVADLLTEYKRSEAAYRLRTYRHKAYYSLDVGDNIEREALILVLSPHDILEQREQNARLYEAIAALPEKQAQRIYAHYILGISQAAIARADGVSSRNVSSSIARGLKNLKKILKEI